MKKYINSALKTLMFFLCIRAYAFDVRVLLDKQKVSEMSWTIDSSAAGGFYLSDMGQGRTSHVVAEHLIFTVKNKKLYVNNKKLATDNIAIKPVEGFLRANGKVYEGFFVVIKDGDDCYLINSVDLEAYVYSVLRWEGWPGWPEEVNKVFAIVFRTYAVHKVLEHRERVKSGKKVFYDLKCTNAHQTYNGLHEYEHLRSIIEITRGVVIAYNKNPIIAMYDACCGGIIPAHVKGFDHSKTPYLARNYACTHCRECKLYNWKAAYSIADVEQLLHQEYPHKKGRIQDIKIANTDKAGVVKQVKIKKGQQWLSLTGKEVYHFFKKVKSQCFTVSKKAHEIVFEGRGYGHLRGMCQWGTRQMVKQGSTYKEVLRFYYPGTSFMKVEYVVQ